MLHLLLLLLLLLSVQRVWGNDQVLNFFGGQASEAVLLAGVDRAVMWEAARAVGRVNISLIAVDLFSIEGERMDGVATKRTNERNGDENEKK